MKILCVVIALALLLGVMAAGGPGDEAAKDRADADMIRARTQSESGVSEAQAYAVMQQADALATAVAISAENQQLAQRAMATSAAVANQYAARALQPPQSSDGIDLMSLAPWAAMIVTAGLSGLSIVLSLLSARQRPRIIYVTDVATLREPRQLYLRSLPPGQSCRAGLLVRGDKGRQWRLDP
jgi:multidrug efflux pump subunit AcrA (membrane-fusion protein)